jgi:hypothetical protein
MAAVVLGRIFDGSHYDLEHRMVVVQTPVHPCSIQLLNYWRECEARGGMRMGRDIPSRAIASLLKDLCVSEPIDDWADARVRLAGSSMTEYFGRDVSGMLMSEIHGGGESEWRTMMNGARYATAHNKPGTIEQTLLDNGRVVLRQEMTGVPIWSPDGEARWLVTGTFNF